MNYRDYIKDKDVIFVGASPILKGLAQGQVIDIYDVVIKTNGSVFLKSDDYHKDYGKRIDVLYTNNQFYREMSPFPLEKWKHEGDKYLRMKTCRDLEQINKVINAEIIKDAIKYVSKDLPSATMGAFIFRDILMCEPKTLMVTGIDFFASKKKAFEHNNYNEYVSGYLPDKIRKQGNEINKGKTKDGHDFYGNADYIHEMYKRHNNFLMPEYVENILVRIVNREIDQL